MAEHPSRHETLRAALSHPKGLRELAAVANISERRLRDISSGRASPSYATAQKIAWAISPQLTARELFPNDKLQGEKIYTNPHGRLVLKIAFVTQTSSQRLLRNAGIPKHKFEMLSFHNIRLPKEAIDRLSTQLVSHESVITCLK